MGRDQVAVRGDKTGADFRAKGDTAQRDPLPGDRNIQTMGERLLLLGEIDHSDIRRKMPAPHVEISRQCAAHQPAVCVEIPGPSGNACVVVRSPPGRIGVEQEIVAKACDDVRTCEPARTVNGNILGAVALVGPVELDEKTDQEQRTDPVIEPYIKLPEICIACLIVDLRDFTLNPDVEPVFLETGVGTGGKIQLPKGLEILQSLAPSGLADLREPRDPAKAG